MLATVERAAATTAAGPKGAASKNPSSTSALTDSEAGKLVEGIFCRRVPKQL